MLRHDLKRAKVVNLYKNSRFYLIPLKFAYFQSLRLILAVLTMHKPRLYRLIMWIKPNFFFKYFFLLFILPLHSLGQNQPKTALYNSLLWEISGNGLAKPSYLFGTMHVSSKMAFHLGDSFYYAIKQADAVALELNPELWQPQMARLAQLNNNYVNYVKAGGNQFLNEKTFRLSKFEEKLKMALSSEPPAINNLLYRSYKEREDFEEDTFLDLYIYQTGRKLGKRPAGVEDFFESQKIVLEAYADMARENRKNTSVPDETSVSEWVEKIQDAYKNGDLDLLDSIEKKLEPSQAFKEKFLYHRNIIQANAIDSIIQTTSLFAGIGAAHLPGERGVIELLRKKGYRLRPIPMSNRDALQKEAIEKKKVNVHFSTHFANDSMYYVDVPGNLYLLQTPYSPLNRWQFADMNNGSYYMVTRVKTNGIFLRIEPSQTLIKIDSLLYENIPGKILSKKVIQNNGYAGFDIVNQTRRGDIQRYQVFATASEIIIFKMSGKNDYINGEEGNRFFSSIHLKKRSAAPLTFTPSQGGFSIKLPQEPTPYYDAVEQDRWEYEAKDTVNGDAYLVMKKSLYNFDFIEEDSFELRMVEESFRSSEIFAEQISRRYGRIHQLPALFVREKLTNGDVVNAAFIYQSPHYYILAKRSSDLSDSSFAFVNSFKLLPNAYPAATELTDSFYKVTMQSQVKPDLDNKIRSVIEKISNNAIEMSSAQGYYSYWPAKKNMLLRSDSTGETVSITIQEYPKYFYLDNLHHFWEKQWNEDMAEDMYIKEKKPISAVPSGKGYYYTLRDTGSSKSIERLVILDDHFKYSLYGVSDTLTGLTGLTKTIFDSFKPLSSSGQNDIYHDNMHLFFDDLFSTDSTTHKKALNALTSVHFKFKDVPLMMKAITEVNPTVKDYFEIKTGLISELGFVNDTITDKIPLFLKTIYAQTADTSLFQNAAIKSLARIPSSLSYSILKKIFLQDPPVFENDCDYSYLFDYLEDSLELARPLFPELLALTTLQDYKDPVIQLLVALVDSGLAKRNMYKKHFPSIYIDAKTALKKQLNKDERRMQDEKKDEEENNVDETRYDYSAGFNTRLMNYAVLLLPYFEKDKNVQQFFNKLLNSRSVEISMETALLLLKNHKPVPDSTWLTIASKDKFRADLYDRLLYLGKPDHFPPIYLNQQIMARSYLVAKSTANQLDSVVFLKKQPCVYKATTGVVYFYKYRVNKSGDWKIGLSGIQPLDSAEIDISNALTILTGKSLVEHEPLDKQLNKQLRHRLFALRKSSAEFYLDDRYYNYDRER